MNSGRLLALIVPFIVTGCSWINDGEGLILNPGDDYMEAEKEPDLTVPEDLRSLNNTDPFPIPNAPQPLNPRYYPKRPPLPDAIYANDNRDEVRIQALGDRRWLVVPEAPTTVWPKLKQFLAENGVVLGLDAPGMGRINTEWLRVEDKSYRDVVRTLVKDAKQAGGLAEGQDRFLIRVEQGLRTLTTEVHIRHENDSLTLPVRDNIENLNSLYSDLDAAEGDFLNEIGAYIAAKVSEQTVSKVALQIGSSEKAELTLDANGDPLLKLYLDYERAWATLGQALDNAEIEITNLDREAGVFFVVVPSSLLTGEEGSGFFCRFTFSCDANKASYDLSLQIYNAQDQEFDISVQDGQTRGRIDPDLAQQVLVIIRDFAT